MGPRFTGFSGRPGSHGAGRDRDSAGGDRRAETAVVRGAGRTDTGVHASGQVIAFDIEWRHGMDALERAINVKLPVDVAVRGVAQCADEFSPRYDATKPDL